MLNANKTSENNHLTDFRTTDEYELQWNLDVTKSQENGNICSL